MSIKYLEDSFLESISGGGSKFLNQLGSSINTYDSKTGLIYQDMASVTSGDAALGSDGDGQFTLTNVGLVDGNGKQGLA